MCRVGDGDHRRGPCRCRAGESARHLRGCKRRSKCEAVRNLGVLNSSAQAGVTFATPGGDQAASANTAVSVVGISESGGFSSAAGTGYSAYERWSWRVAKTCHSRVCSATAFLAQASSTISSAPAPECGSPPGPRLERRHRRRRGSCCPDRGSGSPGLTSASWSYQARFRACWAAQASGGATSRPTLTGAWRRTSY